MSSKTFRIALITAAVALAGSACTAPAEHHDEKQAEAVSFLDQWVTAADTGMAAVFGTVNNTGHHDAHIVAGSSPVAGRVEIHEVVGDPGGTKTMRPKADGLTVAAGATHELAPGGDHLMLMDLTHALQPGADVPVTVEFEDGSTLTFNAQVRDFAGGNEEYSPGAAAPHHDHG